MDKDSIEYIEMISTLKKMSDSSEYPLSEDVFRAIVDAVAQFPLDDEKKRCQELFDQIIIQLLGDELDDN